MILHSVSSSLFLLAMYENSHYSIFFSEFGVVSLLILAVLIGMLW